MPLVTPDLGWVPVNQIIFGTFEDVMERKYKRKQRSVNASAAAHEVNDSEMVDIPVQAGEMVEGSANGSSPGTEESEEEELIRANPNAILPPALGLPEESDKEEPIMATPITIVPPASSLSEGSDGEELVMASPITIVPPASSSPETPDEQNESIDICGSDPEK
ncbi:hypothetical protein ACJRO7_013086 [Eucalyptus globulus]|uniref:Uncharacterized protein n=1 Tax=Eucalyptus globulus TaxID=34317 RepID=A0ABD3LRF3_EUCGL